MDLLAAFAEQSLAGAEREQLVSHLASCEQCRAILWYALPEHEATQTVVAPGRSWSLSTAWRWVGVAAGVIILAGVAMLFRGGPGPAGEKATLNQRAPLVAQRQATAVPEVKQPAAVPSPETRLQARNAPARTAARERLDKQAVARREPGLMARNEAAKEPAARAGAAANQVGGIAADDLAKSSDAIALKDEAGAPAAPAPAPPISGAKVGSAAKAAPASTATAGVMIASNINAREVGKKKLAPPTRWMLSPEGALLRSTDAGANWQAVPFDGSVVFRAVAVVGPRVWVGGRSGALYYSGDDGNQWQRLAVGSGGMALSDEISSLSFRDGQHGSLTTAGGQTWTTSDGGQSWQKQ
jgi:hypothetical protein